MCIVMRQQTRLAAFALIVSLWIGVTAAATPEPQPQRSSRFGQRDSRVLKSQIAPHWFDGDSLVRRKRGDHSINYFYLMAKHIAALEQAKIRLC